METRRPAAELTNGLTTTADKIRALAQANYDLTEISKILGIRYQHVRHVMLRSGLTGGLRREVEAEREPIEVEAAPAPREDTASTVLTDAGFEYIGEWTQDPESLLRLDAVKMVGRPLEIRIVQIDVCKTMSNEGQINQSSRGLVARLWLPLWGSTIFNNLPEMRILDEFLSLPGEMMADFGR